MSEKTEENKKAVKVYENALKAFPDKSNLYLRLARANFGLKRYEEAVKRAKEAVKSGCKDDNMHSLLGFSLEKAKQYKKAIKHLKAAEKISPKEAQINLSLLKCYKNIGWATLANKELDKGIRKLGNSPHEKRPLETRRRP